MFFNPKFRDERFNYIIIIFITEKSALDIIYYSTKTKLDLDIAFTNLTIF